MEETLALPDLPEGTYDLIVEALDRNTGRNDLTIRSVTVDGAGEYRQVESPKGAAGGTGGESGCLAMTGKEREECFKQLAESYLAWGEIAAAEKYYEQSGEENRIAGLNRIGDSFYDKGENENALRLLREGRRRRSTASAPTRPWPTATAGRGRRCWRFITTGTPWPTSRRWSVPETAFLDDYDRKENERCRQEIVKTREQRFEVNGDVMRTFFKSRSLSGGVLFFFLFFLSGDIVPQGDPGEKTSPSCWNRGRNSTPKRITRTPSSGCCRPDALAETDAEKLDVYSILSQVYFDFDEREIARNYMRKMLELAPEKKIDEKTCPKRYWKLFQEAKRASEEESPQIVAMRYRAKIKKRRRLNQIELIGALVLLVGLVVVLKIIRKKKKIKVEPDYDTRVMKIEWVTVPAGEFQMGDNFGDGDPSERPVHTVYLDKIRDLQIRDHLRAVRPFLQGVQAVDHGQSAGNGARDKAGSGRLLGMTPYDFCFWLSEKTGKKIQLPTEAQWEKAARGTDQRKYPWGNTEPNCGLANFNNCVSGTQPVGSYPAGASPYGVMDMAGNAMEWTGDQFRETMYSSAAAYRNPSSSLVNPNPGYMIGGDSDAIAD